MTPAIRSEYGRRRYLYTAVSEFNGLPSELRKLGYLSFKRELREHLHCKLILTRVSFKTTSPCQKCKGMGRQNIIIVLWLDVSTRKMSSHHQHLVVD